MYFHSFKMKNKKIHKTRALLKASYHRKNPLPKNIQRDNELSSKRVSVFHNSNKTKSYVVHRGTYSLKDWATDFAAALGYENGNRFQHSAKIQSKAENKYGAKNVHTLGHSLGGRLAEKVGQNSKSVTTFNKFATPRSVISSHLISQTPNHQTDLRSTNDIASLPAALLERKSKPFVNFKTNQYNPITEHSVASLTPKNYKRANY